MNNPYEANPIFLYYVLYSCSRAGRTPIYLQESECSDPELRSLSFDVNAELGLMVTSVVRLVLMWPMLDTLPR